MALLGCLAAGVSAETILLVEGNGSPQLKPGAEFDGRIARAFGSSGTTNLEGARFECTIARVLVRHPATAARRGMWAHLDHWLFDSYSRPVERGAELRSVRIMLQDGAVLPLDAIVIDAATAKGKFSLVVAVERPIQAPERASAARPEPGTIRAGSEAHLLLTRGLSSSLDRPGDEIRAYLLDPILDGTQELVPSGAILAGRIAGARRPRRFWRGGRMQVTFTRLVLLQGGETEISVSVSGLEPNRQLHAHLGPEGALMSQKPGVVSALRQAGSS